MNLLEKKLLLQKIYPFDQLSENELLLIADVSSYMESQPGEKICSIDNGLTDLIILLDGILLNEFNEKLNYSIIGLSQLITDLAKPLEITSDPEKPAKLLTIKKEHFYTIIQECPQLNFGFMEIIATQKLDGLVI